MKKNSEFSTKTGKIDEKEKILNEIKYVFFEEKKIYSWFYIV